jgi:predicted AAA+ superfamily ATPase
MGVTIENSWRFAGGLWEDPDLQRVAESHLDYRPRPISAQECLQPIVWTLRGPRRAGKTVTLKLLVADLIENHQVNPRDITWVSFETIRNLQQMEDFLIHIKQEFNPKILFIDEVTSVAGWQKVIKKLRDNGTYTKASLVLTGSSAHDLKAGSERMAGRRGGPDVYDRVLLPMSFFDFQRQTQGSVEDFLKVGGFPFRVNEFARVKKQKHDFADDYGMAIFDEVFFYEMTRRKLSRNIAIEIVGRLSQLQTTASSYDGFAKAVSVTKDTVRKYMDALGESFLLATYFSYDTSKNRVAPKKDRKFLWIDPALGDFAFWLKQGEKISDSSKAEMAVGAELLRRYEFRLWEGLSAPRNVFTWKSKTGNEVDFLVVDKSQRRRDPFEVKYQEQISDWDFQVMEKAFGKGILITKLPSRHRPHSQALGLESFLLEKN